MTAARPFIKFVGGKTQLLPELRKHVPAAFGRYYEPFVGGGALFWDLAAHGRLAGGATLSDANELLVKTYKAIRDHLDILMNWLDAMQGHYLSTQDAAARLGYYLTIRDAMGTPGNWGPDESEAARFIFTNKTGYNGLFRVNGHGKFNVPHGKYKAPKVLDADNLRACSQALQGVEIWHKDFDDTVALASPGDFVYFDPPYVPTSDSANFTSYTACKFGMVDQVRLRDRFNQLRSQGVHVLLSNADVPEVRELYRGFTIRSVQARRSVNSKGNRRGPVAEVLVT
jgi:DNA adenine methylase